MANKHKQVIGIGLPFPLSPTAHASLRSGTVYAIDGGDSHIYYGQIAADKSVGFFKYRSEKLSSVEEVLSSELMSRFGVGYQSIGEALRAGVWLKLGVCALREELIESPLLVMWSVGATKVDVWKDYDVIKTVMIHDPEIQNLEIMASYDAVYHVPGRLMADFTGGFNTWSAGGPVWRERVQKEEAARTHPDLPWCALPKGWVHVERPA